MLGLSGVWDEFLCWGYWVFSVVRRSLVKRKEEKKRNSKKKIKKEYLNKIGKKIEFRDVGGIVKWYGIIDKIAF